MIKLIYLFIFITGMTVASFMMVVADRIPKDEDFIRGRSHCDHCHQQLKWHDLIPVISYIINGGRCHYCHTHISLIYPLSEILGGILFVLCFKTYGDLRAVSAFIVMMVLMVIAVIDYRTTDIYNSTQIALLITGIIHRLLIGNINIRSILLSMIIISLPMYLINLVFKDSFGMGDIEMMAVTGIFLTPSLNVLSAFLGIITGGISCIIMMITKRIDKEAHIAFAPYLAIGICVAMLYGEGILSWYFGML